MGTSFDAFIEYDDSPKYYDRADVPPPFTYETDRVIDLRCNIGLRGAKDYVFIGALGGPRNPRGLLPLYRPRGLPPNVNRLIAQEFSPPETHTGWLLLPEVEAALEHYQTREDELCFGAKVALGIMRLLVGRLGAARVRFVFEMSG